MRTVLDFSMLHCSRFTETVRMESNLFSLFYDDVLESLHFTFSEYSTVLLSLPALFKDGSTLPSSQAVLKRD